ncbi:MAG: sodium:proton antiporter [Candidatus Omnitrophica bacterium]|nr:sodium:proton antiporter [Candidatus Omnitrophota bacterium]MCK6495258.1 sodium:proton antiporter [bacterium]NUP91447.1 sodium:proton antiporter [Candidatus Omnitrophota bacterium]
MKSLFFSVYRQPVLRKYIPLLFPVFCILGLFADPGFTQSSSTTTAILKTTPVQFEPAALPDLAASGVQGATGAHSSLSVEVLQKPAGSSQSSPTDSHAGIQNPGLREIPSAAWITPFAALLLAIAIFPLVPSLSHWWEHNSSKLLVAAALGVVTIAYYWLRDFGFPHGGHATDTGLDAVLAMLRHAVIDDFIPFIVLLFSLFVISGGISVSGNVPAHPKTNTFILALGGLLASFIGTTGAAMLLIRPLLQINQERRFVVHTVVFFIFIVCNIGGSLLPVGDPPLFLGYLRGVPFLWTFHLVFEWAFCLVFLLVVYFFWDLWAWKKEPPESILQDATTKEPIRIQGLHNFALLLGVVLCVALLVPGKVLLGWTVPHLFPIGIREMAQILLAGLSMVLTRKAIREANNFNFTAIGEVACLFIGIFITMQVPIEILNARGSQLGLATPAHFFWATGVLSSFLDNAPTYVVFFQTAGTLPWSNPDQLMSGVQTTTGTIPVPLLIAISLGAVFMGANTYIGNGPNFMVKSIAEQAGIKMPSFFGYMLYSIGILIPLFILITLIFIH